MFRIAKSKKESHRIRDIDISQICSNPDRSRAVFDRESIEALAYSIKLHGLINPVVVRRVGAQKYELICGERRLFAARIAHLKQIRCIIADVERDDAAVMSIVENIQRRELSYFEEAQAIARLISRHKLTQEQIAARIGRNQSTVANKLRLLRLSDEVRELLMKHNMSERHARALLKLSSRREQLSALEEIIEGRMNVSQAEEMIDRRINEKQKPIRHAKAPKGMYRDSRIFVNTITGAVEKMEKSGILLFSEKTEHEDMIEFVIRLKKTDVSRETSSVGENKNVSCETIEKNLTKEAIEAP